MIAVVLKECLKCEQSLPFDSFHKQKRGADGYQRWCRDCSNDYRRLAYASRPAWRKRSKEARERYYALNTAHVTKRNRKNVLLTKYGITWEQYQALIIVQGNKCALCQTDTPRGNGSWHVDHNHETGDVRGLLCHSCNAHLGIWQKFQKQFGPDVLSRYVTNIAVRIANAAVKKHPSKK